MKRFCKAAAFATACVLALAGCKDVVSALSNDAVSVGGVKLTITEVTIIPLNGLSATKGTELYFVTTVRMSNGGANTAGVDWTVTGNTDAVTRIIAPGTPAVTGLLIIGPNENAEKLIVTAVSRADTAKKSDPVEVTVYQP
jgi:hypothetical protein